MKNMENMKKMINIKKEILNAVKNVKLEGTKNFDAGDWGSNANVDLVISFDIKGRHIKIVKNIEFKCCCCGDKTELLEGDFRLEEMGISDEDLYDMEEEEVDDLFEKLFGDFNDYCEEVYLDDLLYSVMGDDGEQDFINKLVNEYIVKNIEKIYMVKDAGYACNFETYIDALYVFGEFVGYIKHYGLNIDRNTQLLKKKYVKVGKIFSENNDKVEYEMYWGGLDLAVSGDNKWIYTKYLDEDVYDVKIEENGDIMMADFYSYDDVVAA